MSSPSKLPQDLPSVRDINYIEDTTREPRRTPSSYDRASFIEEGDDPLQTDILRREEKKDVPVTWTSLPHKRQ
jgi:hypothetical protein